MRDGEEITIERPTSKCSVCGPSCSAACCTGTGACAGVCVAGAAGGVGAGCFCASATLLPPIRPRRGAEITSLLTCGHEKVDEIFFWLCANIQFPSGLTVDLESSCSRACFR